MRVGQDAKKVESDAAVVLFEETLTKAKGGDADAMTNLGSMYRTGSGVIEDDKEAVKWWRNDNAHGLGDLAGVDKWFGLKLVIDTVGRQVTGYARGGDGDWVRLNETPLPYYDSEAKGTEIFLGIGSRKHDDGASNVLEMDDIQVMQLTIEGN